MDQDLRKVIEAELDGSEKLLWVGQPSAADMIGKTIIGSSLVLTSVFLESVSLMLHVDDEQTLLVRIGALVLIAGVAAFLIWRLPRQAANTIFAVSDRRVLRLDLSRLVHSSVLAKHGHSYKVTVHDNKNSREAFWFASVTNIFILCLWGSIFLPTMLLHFDGYLAASLILLVTTIGLYIYDQMLLLNADYRNASGILYAKNKKLTYVQSMRLDDVSELHVRRGLNKVTDLFFVSRKDGCLRLKSLVGYEAMESCLPSTAAFAGRKVTEAE